MVSVHRFDKIVLGEIAMVVDCWLFVSFVGCLGSCVVVEMAILLIIVIAILCVLVCLWRYDQIELCFEISCKSID